MDSRASQRAKLLAQVVGCLGFLLIGALGFAASASAVQPPGYDTPAYEYDAGQQDAYSEVARESASESHDLSRASRALTRSATLEIVYDPARSFVAPSGPMVDFAHGRSPGSATAIVTGGLDEAAGAAASAGGRYASPGSFHTFPISPTDTRGLQLAYEMGLRHGDDACVVMCRIPQSTYDDLLRNGDVLIEPIPGVDVPQVVFGPGSFGPINQNAFWDILKPGG